MPGKNNVLDGLRSGRPVSSQKPGKKSDSLEQYLDPQKRIQAKLESALKAVKAPKVVLLLIDSEHYNAVQASLLQFLRQKRGVFVSVNKPLGNLLETPESVVQLANLVFVDMVSESSGIQPLNAGNARYLESPQNLLELAVLTEKELKGMPIDERFAVFDSLSTLLLYNKAEAVERFVHNLAGKIRNLQTIAILLMVHLEEHKDTIRVISQFCDQTIEVAENEAKAK